MFLEATCTPWPKAFPLSSKSAKAVKPFSQYIHSYFISSHISLSRTLFWFPLPCSRTFLIISDPGDNTECVCVCVCVCAHVCLVMSVSLWPHGLQSARLCSSWNFPGKNTGVGCHFFLQGIFLIQGLNPHLLHLLNWQADSLSLCHLGSLYTG